MKIKSVLDSIGGIAIGCITGIFLIFLRIFFIFLFVFNHAKRNTYSKPVMVISVIIVGGGCAIIASMVLLSVAHAILGVTAWHLLPTLSILPIPAIVQTIGGYTWGLLWSWVTPSLGVSTMASFIIVGMIEGAVKGIRGALYFPRTFYLKFEKGYRSSKDFHLILFFSGAILDIKDLWNMEAEVVSKYMTLSILRKAVSFLSEPERLRLIKETHAKMHEIELDLPSDALDNSEKNKAEPGFERKEKYQLIIDAIEATNADVFAPLTKQEIIKYSEKLYPQFIQAGVAQPNNHQEKNVAKKYQGSFSNPEESNVASSGNITIYSEEPLKTIQINRYELANILINSFMEKNWVHKDINLRYAKLENINSITEEQKKYVTLIRDFIENFNDERDYNDIIDQRGLVTESNVDKKSPIHAIKPRPGHASPKTRAARLAHFYKPKEGVTTSEPAAQASVTPHA